MKSKWIKILTRCSFTLLCSQLLLTSCSNSMLIFDYLNDGEFKPLIARKSSDSKFDEDSAIIEYIKDVNGNHKIMESDFLTFGQFQYNFSIKQSEISVITFTKGINVIDIDSKRNYVSLDLILDSNSTIEDPQSGVLTAHYKCNFSIKNIQYKCYYEHHEPDFETEEARWWFEPVILKHNSHEVDVDALDNNKIWNIKGSWLYSLTGWENFSENVDLNYSNYKNDLMFTQEVIRDLLPMNLTFPSDYFKNIQHEKIKINSK